MWNPSTFALNMLEFLEYVIMSTYISKKSLLMSKNMSEFFIYYRYDTTYFRCIQILYVSEIFHDMCQKCLAHILHKIFHVQQLPTWNLTSRQSTCSILLSNMTHVWARQVGQHPSWQPRRIWVADHDVNGKKVEIRSHSNGHEFETHCTTVDKDLSKFEKYTLIPGLSIIVFLGSVQAVRRFQPSYHRLWESEYHAVLSHETIAPLCVDSQASILEKKLWIFGQNYIYLNSSPTSPSHPKITPKTASENSPKIEAEHFGQKPPEISAKGCQKFCPKSLSRNFHPHKYITQTQSSQSLKQTSSTNSSYSQCSDLAAPGKKTKPSGLAHW